VQSYVSFFLQEAVKGMTGNEKLVAVKESISKRLFGTRSKWFLRKGKVCIHVIH
jgi:hypothetical protein